MRPFAVLVVAVLALTGCTPPEPAPSPSPSPTPTPTAEPFPSSTVPLTCPELFSDAEASVLVGTPVTLRSGAQAASSMADIAAQQAGLLDCAWDPVDALDFRSGLHVAALADASDVFDPSWSFACEGDSLVVACRNDALLGSTWAVVSARVNSPEVTIEEFQSRWDSAVAQALAQIDAARPDRAPWTPPVAALPIGACADLPPSDASESPISSPAVAAYDRSDARSCVDGQWLVTELTGGSWAMPALAAELPRAGYELGRWQPLPVAGADFAVWTCGEICLGLASARGSLVQVSTSDVLSDEVPGRIADRLAQILAG